MRDAALPCPQCPCAGACGQMRAGARGTSAVSLGAPACDCRRAGGLDIPAAPPPRPDTPHPSDRGRRSPTHHHSARVAGPPASRLLT